MNKFEIIAEMTDCLIEMNEELQEFIKRNPNNPRGKKALDRYNRLVSASANFTSLALDNNSLQQEIELLKRLIKK